MGGALKNQIVTEVQPVFLYPLVDQLTGYLQVSALTMLQHIVNSYRVIDEINFEENAVKTMEPYEPTEPLARLIKQLEKGIELSREVGQKFSDVMMVSKDKPCHNSQISMTFEATKLL